MANMKIKSKRRLRILRTRSPYGRRLRFKNKENNSKELSSSLLEETSTISEHAEYQKEAPSCTRDTQGETGTRSEPYDSLLEEPNITSSFSEQSSFNDVSKLNNEPTQRYIEESTSPGGLTLSESSVVEESKIKVEYTPTRGLPPSESLVVEDSNDNVERGLPPSESAMVEESKDYET